MTIALRQATNGDLSMIFEAEHAYMRSVEPAHEPDWLIAPKRNIALWRANLDRCTVLEVNGMAAGYEMWTYAGPAATLITINLLPGFRRRGLGLELLEVFVDQARAQGCTRLILGVQRDNPARSLYPRGGFELVGEDGDYLLFQRSVTVPTD